MTDKSYPPPCRNYLKPFYLSVTLYACAQRGSGVIGIRNQKSLRSVISDFWFAISAQRQKNAKTALSLIFFCGIGIEIAIVV